MPILKPHNNDEAFRDKFLVTFHISSVSFYIFFWYTVAFTLQFYIYFNPVSLV